MFPIIWQPLIIFQLAIMFSKMKPCFLQLPSTYLIIRAFLGVASYFTTTLNMNNVDTSMFEESALCIVVLPRKGLHLLSTNSVLHFAVHFKTGCFHFKLYFDNPNCILKLIASVLISFRHFNSKTNYGTRNHLFTFVFQFLFFVFKVTFAFQKPHTFYKLGLNIPNLL